MAAAALLALRIGNTRKAGPIVMVNADPPTPHRTAASPVAADLPSQQNRYSDK
jgi:hypothetical protein